MRPFSPLKVCKRREISFVKFTEVVFVVGISKGQTDKYVFV